MDSKRLFTFFVLSMLIMIGWEKMFPSPKPQAAVQQSQQQKAADAGFTLSPTQPVTVTTDTVKAVLDEKTGDLRQLTLLKHNAASDEGKSFTLLNDQKEHTYIAQADILDAAGQSLSKNLSFTAAQKNYTLNGDKVEVRLSAPPSNGIQLDKVYTFTKGSYLINVRFDITNQSGQPLKTQAVYRMIRDNSTPDGDSYFTHSYAGPVLYTPNGQFQKVDFSTLDKDAESGRDQAEYERKTTSGWVGMSQHYFMSTWILQPKDGASVCNTAGCTISIRRGDNNLYSAGTQIALPEIQNGTKLSAPINLYAGPQSTDSIRNIADNLQLIKDYGRIYYPATALFWLMEKLHGFVGNWGWAIVLLTIIVKATLFPLTNASYKSMAKMRAVAPKLEALKQQHGDDRMALQTAMMQMYRDEKINPLGGCLPMLLQIPVFIGLYWAIFSSVELRQAPWMGWIQDLSRPDPWFILPILMAVTMWFQTSLNPPPSDPMQAKMMKFMPLIFSVMFFFFPAGLVLYYVVNNLLTIAQQWHINRSIEQARKQGEVLDKA